MLKARLDYDTGIQEHAGLHETLSKKKIKKRKEAQKDSCI